MTRPHRIGLPADWTPPAPDDTVNVVSLAAWTAAAARRRRRPPSPTHTATPLAVRVPVAVAAAVFVAAATAVRHAWKAVRRDG